MKKFSSLTNHELFHAFVCAKQQNLDPAFIKQLKQELGRRKIKLYLTR